MNGIFSEAYSFNQDISKWDTSNVEEMLSMFYHAYNFNSPLSGWDTKKVITMKNMFRNCYNFNQDISNFNIEKVKSFENMLNSVSFSPENYYKLIRSWSKQNISKRGNFISSSSRFINDDIIHLKDQLSHKYLWTIRDMGQIYIVKKPGFSKNEFVTVWKDENTSSPMITLPLVQGGKYNFAVDWGDDTVSRITKWDSKEKIHYYNESKIYIVKISGTIIGWKFVDKNRRKLLEIMNWGSLILGDTNNQFESCRKLIISAKDKPDLSQTVSLSGMFKFCSNIEINESISNWDLSSITDMSEMFYGATRFNYDISRWNTKNVTTMNSLFRNAYSFNQDISKLDTSKVTDMKSMFSNAYSFDQDISNLDTSNVTDMSNMFINAHCFNQDISKWDTSKVKSMKQMFHNTHRFNQDLSKWNTANLVNSEDIFKMSRSFDYDISKWKNFNK